MKKYSLGLNW